MKTWKLEDARRRFSEVMRRALAHQPQRVTRDDRDAVVVVSAADYAVLTFARDLVEFARRTATPPGVEETEVNWRQRDVSAQGAPMEDG